MIYSLLAVTIPIGEELEKLDTFKIREISPVLSKFIGLLLVAAAVAALFYLLMGGLQWITSGGDKAGMQAAREKITAAFIGLAIVATAWAVFLLVQWFFGFRILGGPGAPPPDGNGEGYVNCCNYPQYWGGTFRISSAECEAAKSNPRLSQCLGDGQRFRWYQYEKEHCNQFYVNETCWWENQ